MPHEAGTVFSTNRNPSIKFRALDCSLTTCCAFLVFPALIQLCSDSFKSPPAPPGHFMNSLLGVYVYVYIVHQSQTAPRERPPRIQPHTREATEQVKVCFYPIRQLRATGPFQWQINRAINLVKQQRFNLGFKEPSDEVQWISLNCKHCSGKKRLPIHW